MKYEHPSAIYPGTFDAPTKAHFDLMLTGLRMFPSLTVIVASNPDKKPWFTLQERIDMIRDTFGPDEDRLRVIGAENVYVPMLPEAKQSSYVIRGLRTSMDFDYETRLMRLYRRLNPRLQPVYIPTFPNDDMDLISSSMVKSFVGPVGWEEIIAPFLTPTVYLKFVKRAKLILENR